MMVTGIARQLSSFCTCLAAGILPFAPEEKNNNNKETVRISYTLLRAHVRTDGFFRPTFTGSRNYSTSPKSLLFFVENSYEVFASIV